MGYFIVDECDKILESEENRKDLTLILGRVNKDRQLMLFTATINERIQPCLKKILRSDPLVIQLSQNKQFLPNITHWFIRVRDNRKVDKLCSILDTISYAQAVVFVNKI